MREFRDSSHHFRKSYLLLIIHDLFVLSLLLLFVMEVFGRHRGSAKKVNGLEQWQEVENSMVVRQW